MYASVAFAAYATFARPAAEQGRSRGVEAAHLVGARRRGLVAADRRLEPQVLHSGVEHGCRHQRGARVVEVDARAAARRVCAQALDLLEFERFGGGGATRQSCGRRREGQPGPASPVRGSTSRGFGCRACPGSRRYRVNSGSAALHTHEGPPLLGAGRRARAACSSADASAGSARRARHGRQQPEPVPDRRALREPGQRPRVPLLDRRPAAQLGGAARAGPSWS